jgi:hypothetical protein
MNEIICPHCGKAFTIDEVGYADILKGGPGCFERLASMSIVRPDEARRQEDTGTKYPT